MKIERNVSAQVVSWVKSNKEKLQYSSIENLFYPSSISELRTLLDDLIQKKEPFEIIGLSSNTLFLPSYKVKNLICTKNVNTWQEKENEIVCDCGVLTKSLASSMVDRGFVGFEGLTDLPGTIAAGVYGNCGCRGCSVLNLLNGFTLLSPNGDVQYYSPEVLKPEYRTTSLKKKKLAGVILQVNLKKIPGDREKLIKKALENHNIRKKEQPSAANNLGTTFIGCQKTLKGKVLSFFDKTVRFLFFKGNPHKSCVFTLKLFGMSRIAPYIHHWKRYMFLDEQSHELFPHYTNFLKTIYKDLRLEIEIRG